MPSNKPNVFDGQTINANEFLTAHWQRTPYLFRNTTLDLSVLPDAKSLFDLAAQDDVQSRIVYTEDQVRYQAIYDEPEAWQDVVQLQPTLLVSDIEKWHPPAMKLMQWFPFIKNWRFDDLMMSYAPKGASVGAHTDHYDVFLVQVQGSRQWSYDQQPLKQATWVKDSELAVLADYQPLLTHELKAGDVLYLPPEIPHHGISTSDDCITCSIGLRAPSKAELLTAAVEFAAQNMSPNDRYKDAVESINNDAAIRSNEINCLRQILVDLSQQDDQQLAKWFGQYITGYRLLDDFADDIYHDNEDKSRQATNHTQYQKSPFAVFAYHVISATSAHLFVNGDMLSTSLKLAQIICNQPSFQMQQLKDAEADSINDLRAIRQLIKINALTPLL